MKSMVKRENGYENFFFDSNWTGDGPLNDLFPDLFCLNQQPDATNHED